jgi:hypothetical protein
MSTNENVLVKIDGSQLKEDDSIVQKEESQVNKEDDEHVRLSLEHAVFCASGKPAFISGGVVFYILSFS